MQIILIQITKRIKEYFQLLAGFKPTTSWLCGMCGRYSTAMLETKKLYNKFLSAVSATSMSNCALIPTHNVAKRALSFFSGNLIRGKGIRGIVIHGNLMLVHKVPIFRNSSNIFQELKYLSILVYTIENIALDTVS